MSARHVVVIGGGLAGITAALDLRAAGVEVTLLEARPRLGGAASSFGRGELTIDNGQHVFLRCCDNYRALLARLGCSELVSIQDRFDVTVLSDAGPARLRRTALPSPLHMAPALIRYRLLTPAERLAVTRAAVALRFTDPAKASPELDRIRLGDWLAARGQNERARRMLWDLFIVSALNVAGDDASVPLAATVIRTALLGAKDAADIGMAVVPLGDLHSRAARQALAEAGVQVRVGARVTAVRQQPDGRFDVQTAEDSAALSADGVVLAVPAGQAAGLAVGAGATEAARWKELGASPIVNVHVVYDRKVTELPFAAAVGSPVQWVFDKTRQSGLTAGQYLAISLSAADGYIDTPVAQLRGRFVNALEELFPAAAAAQITDFFVTRERRATFRQGPGIGAARPGSATDAEGFVLAGAWTDTGWPDTMEGAVRSGHNAAQELLRQSGAGQALAAPRARRDDGRAAAAMAAGRVAS
jgi:squalene-associated FAD-dependent desaturase